MPEISRKEMIELLDKYRSKIEKQLNIPAERGSKVIFSREYQEFKKEYIPKHLSIYEKCCNFSEKLLKIKANKEKEEALNESIRISHLNITPTGIVSFSILGPVAFILISIILSLLLTEGMFFIVISLFIGLLLIGPLATLPSMIANNWRMKASNQMVLSIFYVVTYMRHTSNLENAINFAAEHLAPPLSLDLKKILWDVETEKYGSIKESLDNYLVTWRKWNMEFIEAFHLIESSLYESSETRRVELLDKSLDVMLEETYEKMLHYAHNLQSPITMLHMLGVVMPILGLVVLPLVVSFMEGVKWYYLATLYNILLPLGVFYLAKNIMSTRPTGYGDTDISETNPEFKKYKNILVNLGPLHLKINPLWFSVSIAVLFILIGLTPILMHLFSPGFDIIKDSNNKWGTINSYTEENAKTYLIGYKVSTTEDTNSPLYGKIIGPFGIGATILSLFIPLGIGLGLGLYFKLRSRNVIKIRENSKKLEKEFASALFQLGNRLGDGIPAELAFERVASTMEGTISGSFFQVVSMNIRKLGMSVKMAIFNPKTGALVYFPSRIIESSMRVLIESVKKGPKIAAQALLNIARYIKEIHRVDERLNDLMAEIISSMKSQIRFLTPVITAIVIGITSMVTSILGKLGNLFPKEGGGEAAGLGGVATMFGDGIPTYYFQIVVGIYVVQVIYILTILTNSIENGSDKLGERYNLGSNLTKSTLLYTIISFIVIIIFNILAAAVLKGSA